jgi:hypothetical protein
MVTAEARAEEQDSEAARAAAEYDAWFRRKVQEALDEANNGGEFQTQEEAEAEDEAWCAEVLREMTPEQRRMVDEIDLDALSEI